MGIKLEKSVGRPVDIILGNEQKCLKVLSLETQVLSSFYGPDNSQGSTILYTL